MLANKPYLTQANVQAILDAANAHAAANNLAMFCSVKMAYTTKGTEGGIKMPKVPPAANDAVDKRPL